MPVACGRLSGRSLPMRWGAVPQVPENYLHPLLRPGSPPAPAKPCAALTIDVHNTLVSVGTGARERRGPSKRAGGGGHSVGACRRPDPAAEPPSNTKVSAIPMFNGSPADLALQLLNKVEGVARSTGLLNRSGAGLHPAMKPRADPERICGHARPRNSLGSPGAPRPASALPALAR